MTTQIELLRLLVNDSRLTFEQLRTVGDALTGRLETLEMAQIAIGIAEHHGWISTRKDPCFIAVEPGQPTPAPGFGASKLYHVSERSWHDEIHQAGLIPTGGGHTSLGRSYPPRLHFAVQLRDALQFVYLKTNRASCDASGSVRCRNLDEIDIYHVTLSADVELFNDDFFDGRGVWTTTAVPVAEVSFLDRSDWETTYRAMYSELFDHSWLQNLPTVQE